MQHEELIARAVELIDALPYLNLATGSSDGPWSSPVYAVHDDALNFYWSSWKEAMHSVNLAADPRAAFTLYDSTRVRGTNNYRCLYIACTVSTIASSHDAQTCFAMLYPGEAPKLDDFLGDGLKRFYKATPTGAWLNCLSERDLTPSTIKMRVELDLDALKAA